MDWNKVRNYIIFMLVVVNLMIIASIIRHNNNASIDNPFFSKKNLESFRELLDQRGIALEADLPRDIYEVGSVNTEYRSFAKENQPDLFQDYNGSIKTFENSKKMQLNLYEMVQKIGDEEYNILNASQQEEFTKAFLAKYFPGNIYALVETKDKSQLLYKVLYNGFVLEESAISFKFGSATVKITAADLVPREISASKKRSITSVEAILSALSSLEKGDTITDIGFVYHFDLPEEDLYKIDNIRSFPCWKITTKEGRNIYILAY